jgi:amino acid transporter
VRQAFGERWGFLAIWADWAENLVWFPTVLSFVAAAFFYVFNADLSNSNVWLFTTMMVIFWGTTLANFLGMRASALMSTIGTFIGSIIPGVLIIILALAWLLGGNQSQIPFSGGALLPNFSLTSLVFMSGVILAWAGMEMAGFHAQETKNPQRDFPRAMVISGTIIVALSILGTLAIALVVPQNTLNLNSGLMQAFQSFFGSLGVSWAIHPLAILITVGGIALLSTWMFGPAKGLRRTAVEGNFPRFFQGRNRQMAPTNILLIQAVIGTGFALLYLFEPTISTSYWILSALTTQLLIVMYVLIFAAVIRLRYTEPDHPRPFRIPGGMRGVWTMGGLGIVGCLTAFVLGFIPPAQIPTGNPVTYVVMMVSLTFLLTVPPFVIHHFRRPSWRGDAAEVALVEND